MAQIHEAIADIMGEVGAIKKDRKNASQGYNFRGIDDVYLAVHDLFVKHGVFSVPTVEEDRTEERTTKGGSALIYRVLRIRYDFFARDGSSVAAVVMGEGMDSGDKASNKAMSVAHKYAILQLLAIPTDDTIDPEVDSHEIEPKKASVNVHETPPDDALLSEVKTLVAYLGIEESVKKALWKEWNGDLEAIATDLRRRKLIKDAPPVNPAKPAAEIVKEMFKGIVADKKPTGEQGQIF